MFKKGNKLGGRKKGSTNKSNTKIKSEFAELLENNSHRLQEALDELEPKEFIKAFTDLSSFILPKMKAVEMESTVEHTINGLTMSDIIEIDANIDYERALKEAENTKEDDKE